MVSPEDDFVAIKQQDARLTGLVESIMKASDEEKDRKTHLSPEQALQIARARAFADSFIVVEEDEDGNEIEIEGPLELIHMICDYLENTSVSVNGRGLKQLEAILTAQATRPEMSELERNVAKVMR